MAGFVAPKIGTGVSVVDKASLYQSVSALLGDMICEQPEAGAGHAARTETQKNMTLRRNGDPEVFRNWVRQRRDRPNHTFELYGLWKDALQQRLLKQIQAKIERDFWR